MSSYAYTSPGVSVTEIVSPSLAPLIASPSTIAIVGAAQGYQSATESFILSGIVAQTFKNTGISTASLVVTDSASGTTIAAGNYFATQTSNPDGITGSGDETYSVQRVAPPATAPTLVAGTGALTGTYVYAISFVNPLGETTIGAQSSQITLTAQGTTLSNIPIDTTNPAGAKATARNIYRAKVTSGVVGTFHLVATLADNTTTTLSNENLSDTSANNAASPNTGIADGGQANFTYQYTNANYYNPQNFTTFADIVDTYGPPFDSNGNISSQLSFACSIAFQNGASEIVACAAKTSGDTDIQTAITNLQSQDVRVVTAISGSSAVHSALAAHCTAMNAAGKYRIGICGRDGTSSPITAATLQAAAKGFNQESIILVSPGTFIFQNPVNPNLTYNVGGQYVAAAIAGMFAARDVQVPLTRKTVAGFAGITYPRTPTQQVQDSQAGLMEIIQVGGPNGPLQVRHGVTTAVQNITTAEASVVRARYELAHRLQATLDGAVVGQVLPINDVPLVVQNVVTSILEQLTVEGVIQAYSNVAARVLSSNLTTVEVRFAYLPSFPINNIVVSFTIDTNTGDFNLSGVTS